MATNPHRLQIAHDPAKPPPLRDPPPIPKRWYGWQLIAAYAPIDFALLWGAYFVMKDELNTAVPFLTLGYGGHFAAGGFIHKMHNSDERKGTGAMLMQVGVMTTGLTAGVIASTGEKANEMNLSLKAAMLAGSIGGAIVAGVIDAGLFSWEPVYGGSAQRNPQWMVLPMPVGEKGMGLGIGGRF